MKQKIENQSLLPVWFIIPLYIVISFLFIGVLGGLFIIPFKVLPVFETIYYGIAQKQVLALSSLIAVWGCAVIFLKYLDKRPVSDLGVSFKGRWKECLYGVMFAAVLYVIGFAVSLLMDVVEVTDIVWDFGILLSTGVLFFVAAMMEEVMVRGYVQGRLMRSMNKFSAMCMASLIFSAMHILNPNVGVLPLINLFLAGLMLGASYMYTRNLAFPIFLHMAWNWIQGPVLGYRVSGLDAFPSVIRFRMPEENIINGGRFGFEGSILCTILIILGTIAIIWWYEREKRSKA